MRDWDKSLHYNTATVEYRTYSGRCYTLCAYCGKPINRVESFEDECYYYNCNCQDAQKEHEITIKIKNLQNQYPQKRFIIEERSVLVDTQKQDDNTEKEGPIIYGKRQ